MVFQALAQYQIDVPQHEDLNLDVSILLPGRVKPLIYRIEYDNAMVVRTAEVPFFPAATDPIVCPFLTTH